MSTASYVTALVNILEKINRADRLDDAGKREVYQTCARDLKTIETNATNAGWYEVASKAREARNKISRL